MLKPCVFAFAMCASSFAPLHAAMVDVNSRSVGLIAGDAAWMPRILSLSDAVNHEQGLRVLPIQSAGCMQSAADVLRLDHVDVALLTVDCVAYAEAQGLLPLATQNLAFLARVEALPVLLITRKNVTGLTALSGLRIATGAADSAAFATGELVLGSMGLPFKRVPKSGVRAITALQTDEADAALIVGLDHIPAGFNAQNFHALPLSVPIGLKEVYAPVLLDVEKLKGLAVGNSFETISVPLMLVTRRSPRNSVQAKRIQLFASVYFQSQQEVDGAAELSTSIPGWQRHAASARALEALDFNAQTLQQGDGP